MSAIVREVRGTVLVLHVCDELDTTNVGELEAAIDDAPSNAPRVAVDFTSCEYIDSSVLNALLRLNRKLAGRLAISVPRGGSLARLFEITSLSEHLSIEDSLGSALTELERR